MYRHFFKRFLDTIMAFLGIIVLGIPMVIIAIAIKLDSKGPVIFKQQRLGKNKKIFIVYKFRTMVEHAYEMGGVASRSDDPRITKVGAFLRRTSLDELPQLFNILKGDMSIIGPRPILPFEFEPYEENERYLKRYNILPGLFCTVDIEYRSSSDRDLQFEMDASYEERITLFGDIQTFFKIILPVATGKNVYKEEAKKEIENIAKEEIKK